MKDFFIAIWNWFKSLITSCFAYQDEPMRETESLLVADEPPQDEMPSIEGERRNSSEDIHAALREPVKLTDEESTLVLYYAHKGANLYLNRLPPEKQILAYELIRKVVQFNIDNIDRSVENLSKLDRGNRLESSWRRVRGEFTDGVSSEFNIIPTCKKMRATATREQATILDHIIHCFNICKIMLRLNLCTHQAVKNQLPRVPTKEIIVQQGKLTESRMNAKTLAIVGKFNQPYDVVPKEAAALPPRRRRNR